MNERRIVETFNTHRMTEEVVRAVASGRDDELGEIMTAVRQVAESPRLHPQPMIVYGERGSGKSFLMRLVEIECSSISQVACVLLPEELYNIRTPAQILDMVTARITGEPWVKTAWQLDDRTAADAWEQAVETFNAAMDHRFGSGNGIALVIIENFDVLAQRLFGNAASSPSATAGKKSAGSSAMVERRQSEERLRKLMNTRGGRFMLIATATGTVDMEYERPLFQAFKPIDLQVWSADIAISYFNRRRAFEGAASLTTEEEARARAIIEFTGGNPRLAQLLSDVLSSPDAHSIAETLDELVDHLADYYRRRLDDLPAAASGLLDALIKGGEPVSQTGLAERVGGQQRQIADSFSFLTRSRLLLALSERGGASMLYRVRDRLFVHFYRRRYGEPEDSRGLAPIAELLEHFYTLEEREVHIRAHLERGEFDDARAFGRLPLANASPKGGRCRYQDRGVRDGPANPFFALAGAPVAAIESFRAEMRNHPDRAFKRWTDHARSDLTPMQRTAAQLLRAIALSRSGHDLPAKKTLNEAIDTARNAVSSDALILALAESARFAWYRELDRTGAASVFREMTGLIERVDGRYARAVAMHCVSMAEWFSGNQVASEAVVREALQFADDLDIKLALLDELVRFRVDAGDRSEALKTIDELLALARPVGDGYWIGDALRLRAELLNDQNRPAEAIVAAEEALEIALNDKDTEARIAMLIELGRARLGSELRGEENHPYQLWQEAVEVFRANQSQLDADTALSIVWVLEQLGRHVEAMQSAQSIVDQSNGEMEKARKAVALRLIARNQQHLGQPEKALETLDQANALALEARLWGEATDSLRETAMLLLLSEERRSEAAGVAFQALDAARHVRNPRMLARARATLFSVAAKVEVPDIAEEFAATIDVPDDGGASSKWFWLDQIFAATARNHQWEALLTVLQDLQARHGDSRSWLSMFLEVGAVWVEKARSIGRASTYTQIATAIPWIKKIGELFPESADEPAGERVARQLSELVSPLLAECDDAGLLLDIADLLEREFGSPASDIAERLKTLAKFHEADDKEIFLQHTDPDLVTVIRKMWNIPEPADALARRGRRRAR